MKNPLFSIVLFSLIGLLILDSCRKPEDFFPETNMLTDSLYFEGSVAAPLIDTKLSLLNFIPETDSSIWVEVDSNDLVHLRMYYPELIDMTMNEIYPEQIFPMAAGHTIPADSTEIRTENSEMKVYAKTLTGNLFFGDPRIKFIFRNEIPILNYYRLDTIIMMDQFDNPISHTEATKNNIAVPPAPGETALDSIMLDKNRIPELPQVFSPVPRYIGFYTTIGNEEEQQTPYALTGEEILKMDVDIDLPLEARLEDLVMSDTLDFMDLSSGEYENIKKVTLKLEFNNGFPFEAISQIYITDATDTGEAASRIDSLFTDTSLPHISNDGWILESAETDASGFVTTPKVSFVSITIDQERLNNLKEGNASKITIYSSLRSNQASQGKFIRILSSYRIGLKMAVKADFNISAE